MKPTRIQAAPTPLQPPLASTIKLLETSKNAVSARQNVPSRLGTCQRCASEATNALEPNPVLIARDSVSRSCTPILNHWLLELSKQGKPKTLSVHVERDTTVLLEHSQPLRYETSQPNGPDCEPICMQSHVELLLQAARVQTQTPNH